MHHHICISSNWWCEVCVQRYIESIMPKVFFSIFKLGTEILCLLEEKWDINMLVFPQKLTVMNTNPCTEILHYKSQRLINIKSKGTTWHHSEQLYTVATFSSHSGSQMASSYRVFKAQFHTQFLFHLQYKMKLSSCMPLKHMGKWRHSSTHS